MMVIFFFYFSANVLTMNMLPFLVISKMTDRKNSYWEGKGQERSTRDQELAKQ